MYMYMYSVVELLTSEKKQINNLRYPNGIQNNKSVLLYHCSATSIIIMIFIV